MSVVTGPCEQGATETLAEGGGREGPGGCSIFREVSWTISFSANLLGEWFVAGVCPFLFNKRPGPFAEKEGQRAPCRPQQPTTPKTKTTAEPTYYLSLLPAKGVPIFSGYTASHQHCPAIWKHHCRVSWFHRGQGGHVPCLGHHHLGTPTPHTFDGQDLSPVCFSAPASELDHLGSNPCSVVY